MYRLSKLKFYILDLPFDSTMCTKFRLDQPPVPFESTDERKLFVDGLKRTGKDFDEAIISHLASSTAEFYGTSV